VYPDFFLSTVLAPENSLVEQSTCVKRAMSKFASILYFHHGCLAYA